MDKRLIDKIQPYKNELLTKLEAVKYSTKNEPNNSKIGLIAQEVYSLEPSLIRKTPQGYLVIDQEGLTAALFSMVKEQQHQIEHLQRELKELTGVKKKKTV